MIAGLYPCLKVVGDINIGINPVLVPPTAPNILNVKQLLGARAGFPFQSFAEEQKDFHFNPWRKSVFQTN